MMLYSSYFFFFFQAEDGIRDYRVTGVQTCALPILTAASAAVTPVSPPVRAVQRPCAGEIGRASCRERGEISVVAVSLKKKQKHADDPGPPPPHDTVHGPHLSGASST